MPKNFLLLFGWCNNNIAKIGSITMRIIASLDFTSAVQYNYDLFHIYHFIIDSFLTETLEPTNDQPSVAHSSLGLSVAPESQDHRFKPC